MNTPITHAARTAAGFDTPERRGDIMVRNTRWTCECRHAVGRVVEFAGRAGIIRYAHCPVCGTVTRQVLERTANPAASIRTNARADRRAISSQTP